MPRVADTPDPQHGAKSMSEAWRIVIAESGGPEVMQRESIALTEPGAGEVRIRNSAIGVNFIDVYRRSGLYPLTLPSGLAAKARA